jgi:hypothetical protein
MRRVYGVKVTRLTPGELLPTEGGNRVIERGKWRQQSAEAVVAACAQR